MMAKPPLRKPLPLQTALAMNKRVVAAGVAASLSIGASGCATLDMLLEGVETEQEVVVCDDAANPDCAPSRDVIVIDESK